MDEIVEEDRLAHEELKKATDIHEIHMLECEECFNLFSCEQEEILYQKVKSATDKITTF
jgi:hypothetical protein